jgi:hypothetical protein
LLSADLLFPGRHGSRLAPLLHPSFFTGFVKAKNVEREKLKERIQIALVVNGDYL